MSGNIAVVVAKLAAQTLLTFDVAGGTPNLVGRFNVRSAMRNVSMIRHRFLSQTVSTLVVGLALLVADRLPAVEMHLSPDGDDAAAGTGDAPLRTLAGVAKAVGSRQPGSGKEAITVIMHGGRYPVAETVTFGGEFAGTREHPIRFRAAEGEDVAGVEYIRTADNREIAMDVFRDVKSLDFRTRPGASATRMPEIPFDKIGLIADGFRRSVPVRGHYRAAVREHSSARPSYDPKAVYDPATISETVYFNSGHLLSVSGGMIHAAAPSEE